MVPSAPVMAPTGSVPSLDEALEVGDQDEERADDERGDDREDRDDRGLEGPADAPHSAPPISMPSLLVGRLRALQDPHDVASQHHGHPVSDRQDLVQLGADDEDGGTGIALLHHPLVDVLDRPHVEAAGRLRGDDQLDGPGELAGHDDLLLVAARERPGVGVDGRRPDVVVLDRDLRALRDRLGIEASALAVRLAVVGVEDEVLGRRSWRRSGRRASGPRARGPRRGPRRGAAMTRWSCVRR